jgi:hypothetical protein
MITKEQVTTSEKQIYERRKSVRYDIRELTIEIIINKYIKGLEYQEDDESQDKTKFRNVLFIPEYQRDFTWNDGRQSRFIESVLLGLPIPLVFVAENKDSAWEIVDGSQRIRTLESFYNNKLTLKELEKLNSLNGFQYQDLDVSRQGKFQDTPLRMIVLSEDADDEAKQDMFERINRGSETLKPMQLRKNTIRDGSFTKFIYELCEKDDSRKNRKWQEASTLLKDLTPMDKWTENRDERQELILRFFALTEYINAFPKKDVQEFLDDFLKEKNDVLKKLPKKEKDKILNSYYERLLNVLHFIKKYSEYGFRENNRKKTKRVVFEALSVGVYVFLKNSSEILCSKEKITEILNSEDFKNTWSGNPQVVYALDRVQKRINFVANKLLEK